MKKDNSVYLEHILIYSIKIIEYLHDKDYSFFLSSEEAQNHIIRMLEIIGEASVKISSDLKDKYPKVPWSKMKATRNILVHEYGSVSINVIWNTAKEAIPELRIQIIEIIRDINPQILMNYE